MSSVAETGPKTDYCRTLSALGRRAKRFMSAGLPLYGLGSMYWSRWRVISYSLKHSGIVRRWPVHIISVPRRRVPRRYAPSSILPAQPMVRAKFAGATAPKARTRQAYWRWTSPRRGPRSGLNLFGPRLRQWGAAWPGTARNAMALPPKCFARPRSRLTGLQREAFDGDGSSPLRPQACRAAASRRLAGFPVAVVLCG